MVIALNNHRDISRKIHEITTIKNNANQKENIVLIGTQAKNYRHLTDNVQVIISQDLSSFRLTLERFYSLIR